MRGEKRGLSPVFKRQSPRPVSIVSIKSMSPPPHFRTPSPISAKSVQVCTPSPKRSISVVTSPKKSRLVSSLEGSFIYGSPNVQAGR